MRSGLLRVRFARVPRPYHNVGQALHTREVVGITRAVGEVGRYVFAAEDFRKRVYEFFVESAHVWFLR